MGMAIAANFMFGNSSKVNILWAKRTEASFADFADFVDFSNFSDFGDFADFYLVNLSSFS